MIPEFLSVDGFGDTRQKAKDACHKQAKEYFGSMTSIDVIRIDASAQEKYVDGSVILWKVEIQYRRVL